MKHDGMYRIDSRGTIPPRADAALLGNKGAGLARMARIGLPVPPAFVLGTSHSRRFLHEPERFGKSLPALLEEQVRWLQSATGSGFGDARKPLLVSVRSGAPVSMPGMMDTLLNVGLCDATLHGLLRVTGIPRLVWDSYRRLIQGFAEVLHGAGPQPFEAEVRAALDREHVERLQELDFLALAGLARTNLDLYRELTGEPFPQDPVEQLASAVRAVMASWNAPRAAEYRRINGIADDLGTAVVVQQMVFGNGGGTSGAGVGFTRDPDTGEKRLFVDFLFDSQGEDVVSGRAAGSDTERLFHVLPGLRRQLQEVCATLEREYGDAQEFEFTVQDGVLYLLQTRTAKRTPWAALRIAVELVGEGLAGREEALDRLAGLDLNGIHRTRLSPGEGEPLCQGQPAGIGVAIGPLALDADAVRRAPEKGRPALLVRDDIATADIAAIALAAGVLTARGNRTSHAAVVARQLGKGCVTGCRGLRIDPARHTVAFGGRSIAQGDTITLDSNTGRVYAGEARTVIEYPTAWLDEIGKWR
jgi:pyruvate,orthophosphate dikinase